MVEETGSSMTSPPYPRFLELQTSTFLLVPEWSTGSIFGLVGGMLAAVVASVTFQCLNEYLQHLRRKSITCEGRTRCCGAEVVTVYEKLGQAAIHIFRVICAYFMMLCVVTMNVWLLISVAIGAAVGYGVGKPLVANQIRDSITSHGYKTARMEFSHHGRNRSERSKSWRYQPIQKPEFSHLKHGDDHAFSDSEINTSSKYSETGDDCAEIVWIRRSSDDLTLKDTHLSEVFTDTDNEVQLRNPENSNSIRSASSLSTRSLSRFRSTSKVINDSLMSSRSDRSSSFGSDSRLNSSILRSGDTSSVSGKRKSSHVSRTLSSTSTGRFKPVSRQINKQLSFNEDLGL